MMFQCVTCHKEDVLVHEPRMLDCGHLICLKCIPKETFKGVILCPKCLGDTPVPPSGLNNIQQGPLLKQLTDLLKNAEQPCAICRRPATYKCTQTCSKVLCANCLEQSASVGCKHNHAASITMHCQIHKNFLVSEYCSDCSRLLCTRCITEDNCSNPKINVKESINKLQITTQVPEEDLQAKRNKLEQLRKQLAEIEQEVLNNSKEIIEMTLKTEKVILQQLQQNKQAIDEQMKSADILLKRTMCSGHHNPITSNGPAIKLLMEKLQLQMLEACIKTPINKLAYTKGSIKPSKLIVYSENTLYDPVGMKSRIIENVDSWEINDVYQYVCPGGVRITPSIDMTGLSWTKNNFYTEAVKMYGTNRALNGEANGSKISPDLNWIKNEKYIKADAVCTCKNGLGKIESAEIQKSSNLNWTKNEKYITAASENCNKNGMNGLRLNLPSPLLNGGPRSRSPNLNNSPNRTPPLKPKVTSAQNSPSMQHRALGLQEKATGLSPTKIGPQVPPKPKECFKKLQMPSSTAAEEVDSAPTPKLDPNFVQFAKKVEDYNYVEDYIPARYTAIDWTYPPDELKNWTNESSKILVIPDGQTILTYHTGSSTQIASFNDSGQQKRKPVKVNYKVLDMTYSVVHKCIVLIDKKSVHYMDIDKMKERWKFEIPKSEVKDYSQLSCAMLRKGFLLILFQAKDKLQFCITELSETGVIQQTAFSNVSANTQHLFPFTGLEIKTDTNHNIYIVNKDRQKIVIINAKCKFRPVLTMPSNSPPLPPSPEPGIFVLSKGRVGYVESKTDDTFSFYWIETIKETLHLADSMEQIICVGSTGLHVYNKNDLFAQTYSALQARASPRLNTHL